MRTFSMSLLLLSAVLASGAAWAAAEEAPTTATTTTVTTPKTEVEAPVTGCLRDTGTRIKPRAGECNSVAGRSYNSEQFRQTGQVNVDQALRQLDPSITIQR